MTLGRAGIGLQQVDGNAAFVVSAKDRSVDGRAEILRIGSRHLLDLLDVHTPGCRPNHDVYFVDAAPEGFG